MCVPTGAILWHNKPIEYWSRSLTKAVKSYNTTQCECLTIEWLVLTIYFHFKETRFTIRTDHKSLACILNLADVTTGMSYRLLRFPIFDFDIFHCAGSLHHAFDALSCLQTIDAHTVSAEDAFPVPVINTS